MFKQTTPKARRSRFAASLSAVYNLEVTARPCTKGGQHTPLSDPTCVEKGSGPELGLLQGVLILKA